MEFDGFALFMASMTESEAALRNGLIESLNRVVKYATGEIMISSERDNEV